MCGRQGTRARRRSRPWTPVSIVRAGETRAPWSTAGGPLGGTEEGAGGRVGGTAAANAAASAGSCCRHGRRAARADPPGPATGCHWRGGGGRRRQRRSPGEARRPSRLACWEGTRVTASRGEARVSSEGKLPGEGSGVWRAHRTRMPRLLGFSSVHVRSETPKARTAALERYNPTGHPKVRDGQTNPAWATAKRRLRAKWA